MYHLDSYKIFEKKKHTLSGIALFVDDEICLVLPKKYKGDNKFSIPKGHIEEGSPFYNAYLELKEETGIDIGLKNYDNHFKYSYKKNGVKKNLDVFVIHLTKEEFENLNKVNRNKKEISEVVFVNKKKALELVENKFKKLIKYLYK
jgi:8-oxo-dGTP pyrophosphatase MutT (NUDIX family)